MSESLEHTILNQLTSIGKSLGELSSMQKDMEDIKNKVDKVTELVKKHDDNLDIVKQQLEDIDERAREASTKYKQEIEELKQDINVIYISLGRFEVYDKNIQKIGTIAKNTLFNNKALKIVLGTIFTAFLFGLSVKLIDLIAGNDAGATILEIIKSRIGG